MPRKREWGDSDAQVEMEIATPDTDPLPSIPGVHRPAPTDDEVRAYWLSGRTRHEAKRLMDMHRTTDAVSGASIYYLPEYDDEGQEKPAPNDLTKVR